MFIYIIIYDQQWNIYKFLNFVCYWVILFKKQMVFTEKNNTS